MALKAHPDLNLDTSNITKNIVPISKKVSRLMNMPTQRNKAIVGAMLLLIHRVFIKMVF